MNRARTYDRPPPRTDKLYTWQEFHDNLEGIAAEAHRSGCPAELTDLDTSPMFKKPFDHLRLGTGKKHILLNVGVHPNEPLGMTTALWIADYFARNKELLEKHDLTVDVICSDPDGIILNQGWIEKTDPTIMDYTFGSYRDWHAGNDAGWQMQESERKKPLHKYRQTVPEGHRVAFYYSLHNSPLYSGAWAHTNEPERQLDRWIKNFQTTARRTVGLLPDPGLADGAAWAPLYPGAEAVFELERGEAIRKYIKARDPKAETRFGTSDSEYMEQQFPGVICLLAETNLWRPSRYPRTVRGKTVGEIETLTAERNGPLRHHLNNNLQGLDAFPRDRTTLASMRTNFKLFPHDFAFDPGKTGERTDLDRILKPDVAFHLAYINGTYNAHRAALVVRYLESLSGRSTTDNFTLGPSPKHTSLSYQSTAEYIKHTAEPKKYGAFSPEILQSNNPETSEMLRRNLAIKIIDVIGSTIEDGEPVFMPGQAAELHINAGMRAIERTLDVREFEFESAPRSSQLFLPRTFA